MLLAMRYTPPPGALLDAAPQAAVMHSLFRSHVTRAPTVSGRCSAIAGAMAFFTMSALEAADKNTLDGHKVYIRRW